MLNKPVTWKHILILFGCFCLLGAGTGGVLYCNNIVCDQQIDIKAISAPAVSSSSQARLYIDSTTNGVKISQNGDPYSALGYSRNKIINGNFKVFQRGTVATQITTAYGADRFNMVIAVDNAGQYTYSQQTAVTAQFPNAVSGTAYNVYCANANSSVSAGTQLLMRTTIEGNNIPSTWISNPITVSFWCSAPAGTWGLSLHNANTSKGAMTTFTTSASTAKFVSQTFTGDATYNTGTSAGLELDICLIGGSTFQGTAGTTFTSGNNTIYTTSSQTNFGASSQNFYITDLQMEEGSAATAFQDRSQQQELALCQRYCWVSNGTANFLVGCGYVQNSTTINAAVYFPVKMRTTPVLTFTGTIGHLNCGQSSNFVAVTTNPPALTALTGGPDSCLVQAIGSTGAFTANNAAMLYWNSSATTSDYLIFNADY